MSQIPQLDNQEKQKALTQIIFRIRLKKIEQADEIFKLLSGCIQDLNQVDQDKVLQYINLNFHDQPYTTRLNISFNPPKQVIQNLKQEFQKLKQEQQFQRIIEMMQTVEFWNQQVMPEPFRNSVHIFQKLNQRNFFNLLELIELNVNQKIPSQFFLMKILLEILYSDPENLSSNEQTELEKLVGSLLKIQMSQLEYYIQGLRFSKNYDNLIDAIRKKQKKTEEINDKKLMETPLFELLTQDLKQPKYLDLFFMRKLGIKSHELKYELIIECLQDYVRDNIDIEEYYFKVVIYFWGKYCSKLIEAQDNIQQFSPMTDEEKMVIINTIKGQDLDKNYDQGNYIIDRIIYFHPECNLQKDVQFKQYSDFQDEQRQLLMGFQSEKIDVILNQNQTKLKSIWGSIQQFQYFTFLNTLNFFCDQVISQTIKIFWMFQFDFEIIIQLKCFIKKVNKQIESVSKLILLFLPIKQQYEYDLICLVIIYCKIEEIKSLVKDKAENYFQIFNFVKQFYKRYLSQNLYPERMEISLEDFNISLVQNSKQQDEKVIIDWIQQMSDSSNFKQLVPFFFNIIKRQQSSYYLTTLIQKAFTNSRIPSQFLNFKALFQIFYNNSNEELKMTLLRLQSKYNPVPFLYQNEILDTINSEDDLYKINQNLYDIFPKCYSIINFSLSQKQGQIGKTSLINHIFYQNDEKFSISDNCEMNKNTIDIMFDFSFNGSRNLAVADVHGFPPINMLAKILHLFQFWIIQIDTEQEFQQNQQAYQQIRQKCLYQPIKVLFLIRNSSQSEITNIAQNFNPVHDENILIYCLPDLTQKGLDKVIQDQELNRLSKFIYEQIMIIQSKQFNCVDKDEFLKVVKQFEKKSGHCYGLKDDKHLIIELVQELEKIQKEQLGFYSDKAFPLRNIEFTIEQKKKEIYSLHKNQIVSKTLQNEIDDLEASKFHQEITQILHIFCSIFEFKNYYNYYILVAETIQQFNKNNSRELFSQIQSLNEEILNLKRSKNNQTQDQNYDQIINNKKKTLINCLKEIQMKNISVEIFWREIINFFNMQHLVTKLKINPVDIVYDMIRKGEPFEFLDGDSLKINIEFFQKLAKRFKQDCEEERMLILSVLGPQSSGKSTILNKIFGCHFWTSAGRCTKGIYIQLLKVHNKQEFDNAFDYVLLLDTEGLQNPNQRDPEFDNKIALLILAISDIILITVKGDINQQFKNLIEMCIYTLGQIRISISFTKSLCWFFNQNSDLQDKDLYLNQIDGIINNLNVNYSNEELQNEKIDYHQILEINKDKIFILGFSQTEIPWKFSELSGPKQWQQQNILTAFSDTAFEYGIQIIKNYSAQMKQNNFNSLSNLSNFFQKAKEKWESIIKLPDLHEFSELVQFQNNKLIKKEFEKNLEQQDLLFIKDIQQDIVSQVQRLQKKSTYQFTSIQNQKEREVDQKLQTIQKTIHQTLLQFAAQNNISKKITNKYKKQLERWIQCISLQCHFMIIEYIKKFEREYQAQEGFRIIEEFVQSLSIDNLKIYQKNQKMIELKFNELWDQITVDQIQQQETAFEKFQFTEYQSISNAFTEYQLTSEQDIDYQQFFRDNINQQSPLIQEKEQFSQIFQKFEVEQYNQQQFMVINNAKNNIKYLELFNQNIQNRLKLKDQIIDLNSFVSYTIHYILLSKDTLTSYLNNNLKQDLLGFIKKQQFNLQIFQSYSFVLKELGIKLNEGTLENLINGLKKDIIHKIDERTIVGLANSFIRPMSFDQNQKIKIKQASSLLELNNYFPTLKPIGEKHKCLNKSEIKQLEQELLRKYIIVEKRKLISPECQLEDVSFFQYIIDRLQNAHHQNSFLEGFPNRFNLLMREKQGWKNIYFQLYEIIKQEMFNVINIKGQNENQNQNDQFDEDIIIYSFDSIQLIIGKIQSQIEIYNQQFSSFGLILTTYGERCLYYYCVFIIWRFICYKKWNILQIHKKCIDNMKQLEFEKFTASIMKNKKELSYIKAKIFVEKIFQCLMNLFYLQKSKSMKGFVLQQKQKSSDVIRFLDQDVLIKRNATNEQILTYIQNQRMYIEKYTNDKIVEICNMVQNIYQAELQQEIKDYLSSLKTNADILQGQIIEDIKTKQYFKEQLFQKDEFYESKLYQIVVCCLQGKQSLLLNDIESIHQDTFKRFQPLNRNINFPFEGLSDEEIQQLKPFIEEVSNQLLLRLDKIDQINLNINKCGIRYELDEVRLSMLGCPVVCPLCKRKCDEPLQISIQARQKANHKHYCHNGHQLRGMNQVLIDDSPSLFLCEEMNDTDILTIKETQKVKTWNEIRLMYPDWQFRSYDQEKNKQNIEKMMNIWNGGIGSMMCQQFSMKLKKKIYFQLKYLEQREYLKQQSIHYIFVLDDSTSMKGKKWEISQQAVQSSVKDIGNNPNAKISLIVFNHQARLLIDCQPIQSINLNQKLDYQGGNTSFTAAFQIILQQLKQNEQLNFEKTVILFYTDGQALYPKQQIIEMSQLSENLKQKTCFIICTEIAFAPILSSIKDFLKPHLRKIELKTKIRINAIQQVWSEIVSQQHHQLHC